MLKNNSAPLIITEIQVLPLTHSDVTQMMVNDNLKTHQEDASEYKLRQDQSNRNIHRSIKLYTYFILLYSNDVT